MKRAALIALALTASTAHACELPKLEAGYFAAATADMATTLDIRHHYGMYETNPILGKHPSDAVVYRYFAATDLAHAAISCLIPQRFVPAWELSSIAFELTYAARNYSMGLRFHF